MQGCSGESEWRTEEGSGVVARLWLKLAGRWPNLPTMSEAQIPGSAVLIESLYEDAQRLEPEAFEARHGSGFLLVSARADSPGGSTSTVMLMGFDQGDPNEHTANLSLVVYPLRAKKGSADPLITMGRQAQHDVVIPDKSVTRFHAFAKVGENGEFLLQDAGSTNGTTVNGASVPPRGTGPPTPLKPGDNVRLGQVEFTFTDARALREFVLQVGGG